MLRIQSNTRYHKLTYEPIKLYNGTLMSRNDNVMVPVGHIEGGGSGHYTGDIVQFERHDGSKINFTERRAVQSVENAAGYDRFVLIGFDRVNLYFDECNLVEKSIIPGDTKEKMLYLHLTNEHFYLKNRDDDEISGFVNCSFIEENREYGCPGDLIVHDDIFLLKIDATEQDGKYRYGSSNVLNYKTTIYVEKNGEIHALNAIVPVYSDGTDNTNAILLYGNDSLVEEIASNPYGCTFYGKDERFFTESASFVEGEDVITTLVPTQGTEVKWRNGDLRLNVFSPQTFDTTLGQDDAISQFIQEISDNAINKIVDYEKQQFVPVKNEKDVSKIVFKIHLRERTDFEEWKTNDSLLWFNYAENNLSGDSVYYMGFDEEDIYYQKKKVSETFLRISIYDTPHRRNQKLLYTAKIFLNESDLYGKYIDNLQKTGEVWFNDVFNEYSKAKVSEGKYSISGCPLAPIQTEFTCTHKYDYDNPTEGFYLHLFPSHLVNESDDEKSYVYMKCELNNAKYGYTLPLVNFHDGIVGGYMVRYTDDNGQTGYTVDMGEFYKDAYILIVIKENDKTGRYEWEFENDNIEIGDDGTIVLQMFEPRINGDSGKIRDDQQHTNTDDEDSEGFDGVVPYVPPWVAPEDGGEPGDIPEPSGGGTDSGTTPGGDGGGTGLEEVKLYAKIRFVQQENGTWKVRPWLRYDGDDDIVISGVIRNRDGNETAITISKYPEYNEVELPGIPGEVVNSFYYFTGSTLHATVNGIDGELNYKNPNYEGTVGNKKYSLKKTFESSYNIYDTSGMGTYIHGSGSAVDELDCSVYFGNFTYGEVPENGVVNTGKEFWDVVYSDFDRTSTENRIEVSKYAIENFPVSFMFNGGRLAIGPFYSSSSAVNYEGFSGLKIEKDGVDITNLFGEVEVNYNNGTSLVERRAESFFYVALPGVETPAGIYTITAITDLERQHNLQDSGVWGCTYSIKASISPYYIEEIKEGRSTDYEIKATLYRINNGTGRIEASTDWTKYGVGMYRYCKPNVYDLYGYRYVTMYEDENTNLSTITITENAEEFKYVSTNAEEQYRFVGIVNGKIVVSNPLTVNYCTKLLKYSASGYLYHEDDIVFDEENNALRLSTYNGLVITGSKYLSANGNEYECEYTFTKTVGGNFGIEPGKYYVVFGHIYSPPNLDILKTIRLYRDGNEIAINDDTNTPWKYEDVGDNIYVRENMTTYRNTILSKAPNASGRWISISEPITVDSGPLKIVVKYTVKTNDQRGTCNPDENPYKVEEVDVDIDGNVVNEENVNIDVNIEGEIVTSEATNVDVDIDGDVISSETAIIDVDIYGKVISDEVANIDVDINGLVENEGITDIDVDINGEIMF